MSKPAFTDRLSILPAGAPVEIEPHGEETLITVPSGTEAALVEKYEARPADAAATQGTLRITVGENARLTHYKVVREAPAASHHTFLEAKVERSGSFQSHVFLFGGAHVRNTIHVRLAGDGAECSLNGLYLARGEQVMETHTLIEHLRPHGTSREFYKGILDDRAQGLFDGLIVVGKEAQQTDSSQTNKNLLLSPLAKAKSNPELKILANDVKCKHGSTIGQIDPSQLFYLRARGIPEAEARRLLVYAFASEMIALVGITELRTVLEQQLLENFRPARRGGNPSAE